ncbi:MAG: siderophore-interacting protein [Myxococcota bacterium]
MVKRKGRSGEVVETEWLSEALRRIVWQEEDTPTLHAGDKIKIHVGDGVMRSYTPSAAHEASKTMEIIAHVHGNGVGSAWARDITRGDELRYMGPAKSFVSTAEDPEWAVFYGDETAVGLAKMLMERAGVPTVLGALELEPSSTGVSEALGLGLDEVARREGGTRLVTHLESLVLPNTNGVFWLSGEASTVLALREALLTMGYDRAQICLKAYWSVRGKAHRKKLEQGALRS